MLCDFYELFHNVLVKDMSKTCERQLRKYMIINEEFLNKYEVDE